MQADTGEADHLAVLETHHGRDELVLSKIAEGMDRSAFKKWVQQNYPWKLRSKLLNSWKRVTDEGCPQKNGEKTEKEKRLDVAWSTRMRTIFVYGRIDDYSVHCPLCGHVGSQDTYVA